MEYFFLIILPLLLIMALAVRPITVFFHELGHAIPMLILTRKEVSIFIGSRGKKERCFGFKLGMLHIWFRKIPFMWQWGICIPSSGNISINRQILYIACGPLASISLAAIAICLLSSFDLHGSLKLILVLMIGSSLLDFLSTAIPYRFLQGLDDDLSRGNDAYQIRRLLFYKGFKKKYDAAIDSFESKRYAQAAEAFNGMLIMGQKDKLTYRLAMSSFAQLKNHNQAKQLIEEFVSLGSMDTDDYATVGYCYSQLNMADDALYYYDKSLELEPSNPLALNNKAFALSLQNKFQESIPLLDKVIQNLNEANDPGSLLAYSYCNRGLAKVQTDNKEEGLQDIQYSLQLDPNNAYAYRNLGVYHLEIGEN